MPGRSFNRNRYSTSGQRHLGPALAACLALDVLELVDPDAGTAAELKAATATVAAPVTLTADDLLAAGLTKLSAHGARAITFTTAGTTASDAPANVVITGSDIDGNEISETLNLAQTAAAVTSVKCYSAITSLAYPAADGTGATIAIGIADKFGLPSKPKTLAGGVNVLKEIEDGAAPATAGTFQDAATSAPYGSYTPNSTPDGSKDFGVVFEHDPN